MAATATELTSRWENLIGIGFETVWDNYVVPSLWLPIKELLPIEDSTELITPKTPVGRLLPTTTYPSVFGLKKGKAKLTCVVPWCDGIATLLSKSLAKVTTAAVGVAPPYSHILEPYDAAGYALSRNTAGISLTKINGAYTEKLSGCRIVGFKLVQKQNAPLEMELEIEGGTYARGEVGALAPSITFAEGSSPTKPYVMFSQAAVAIEGGGPMSVQEIEFELKFKATADDGAQPLGSAARSRLDILGLQAFCRFKRVFAYDDSENYRSDYQKHYEAQSKCYIAATWTGPTISDSALIFKATLGDTDDNPAAVVSKPPKITDNGGVITEEVEIEGALINTTASNKFPFWLTIYDSSATPATWPV